MEKKRILVVDDEEEFVRLLEISLERREKYEVKTLPDAKDIASKVREFRPDIILLDVMMPGVSGYEVCQILNDEPSAKGTSIIIISVFSDDADIQKAYTAGAIEFFPKPIDTEQLFAKIDKILGYKSA